MPWKPLFRLRKIIRAYWDCMYLWRMHVLLGQSSNVRNKLDCLHKKELFWSQKMTYEETFQTQLKFYLFVGWPLKSFNAKRKKKWRGNRKKRFFSEMWKNTVCGGNQILLYLSEPGIRHRLDETVLDCECLCILLRVYNCLQF